MPSPDRRALRSRRRRLLAVAVLAPLVAGLLGLSANDTAPGARSGGSAGGSSASGQVGEVVPFGSARSVPSGLDARERLRERAVRALLTGRATAVRGHDRSAFLATVDRAATTFATRQRRLFDALSAVPLISWDYELDAGAEPDHDARLDRRRGPGWWAPGVTLRYALAGERAPTTERQHLTFVSRRGRWLIAADDDFARLGRDTPRDVWDEGPVVAVSAVHSLVLGHPGSRLRLRAIASAADAAVPRVDAVWGTGWDRRVIVVVPDTPAELGRLLGTRADLSQVAAVATAELEQGAAGYHPVGNRVTVNPAAFQRLGSLGRRVVMTHEVTHVASRAATGPSTPTWLAEGFADYVAYRDVGVPLSVSAHDLRTAVRAGHPPTGLPLEQDFDAGNPTLTAAYEQSWLAVSRLAERYGTARLLRFYRAVGGAGRDDPDALARALRSTYGLTEDAFVADWLRTTTRRLR